MQLAKAQLIRVPGHQAIAGIEIADQLAKHDIVHLIRVPGHRAGIETADHWPNMTAQLIWVPGHQAIAGIETAAQLAKPGSEWPLMGPELACSISMGSAKKVV